MYVLFCFEDGQSVNGGVAIVHRYQHVLIFKYRLYGELAECGHYACHLSQCRSLTHVCRRPYVRAAGEAAGQV